MGADRAWLGQDTRHIQTAHAETGGKDGGEEIDKLGCCTYSVKKLFNILCGELRGLLFELEGRSVH